MPRSLEMKQGQANPDAFDIINDTEAHVGHWSKVEAFDDDVAFVSDGVEIDGVETDITDLNTLFTNGRVLYGYFTKITLSAGTLVAYR